MPTARISPPSVGATIGATDNVMVTYDSLARPALPEKLSRTTAKASTGPHAAPTPSSTRQASSAVIEGASAAPRPQAA